jgi:hypothetical protein
MQTTNQDPAEGSRAVIDRELKRQSGKTDSQAREAARPGSPQAKAGATAVSGKNSYDEGVVHGAAATGFSKDYAAKPASDLGEAGPAKPGMEGPAKGLKNPEGEFENPAPMDLRARPAEPKAQAQDLAGQQGSTRHGNR